MSISIPFTPPTASMNRVRIVDLPGLPIDDEVRGQQAYHLISALAIVHYAQQRAGALKLPEAYRQDTPETRRELPRFVDQSLGSPDADVRAAAEAITRRLGRNLGHVLLTLHRGDAINRAARPDWTDAEWEYWATIRHIWVGGGVMSGLMGERMVRHAEAFLEEMRYGGRLRIARTPRPRNMPLLGAARYLPAATSTALCLDFGATSVKRARLTFDAGTLTQVRPYATLPVEWQWQNSPEAAAGFEGQEVLDFVADAIARTWGEARAGGTALSPDVMLSVAAYVRRGELLGNGGYARMMLLAAAKRAGNDVRPALAEAVYARTGERARICVIHDGTAAAALHAGKPNAAVLIFGTAIGVGFPPETEANLRPLARDLDTGRS